MNWTTFGPQEDSVTSRDVREMICSQRSSTDGSGLDQTRRLLQQTQLLQTLIVNLGQEQVEHESLTDEADSVFIGHLKIPQPDNAEEDINGSRESCLGLLNNIYNDGIKWHDIACYHPKPFMCEDSDALLDYVAALRQSQE